MVEPLDPRVAGITVKVQFHDALGKDFGGFICYPLLPNYKDKILDAINTVYQESFAEFKGKEKEGELKP